MAELTARAGLLPASHLVPDILAPNLKVVFCGTALGFKSAAMKAYYANPGNFFWRTLHRIGLTPHLLTPEEYAGVIQYGLGLTDLCKHAYGQDAELPADAFDIEALRDKIDHYHPRFLAFTSKTGASAFVQQSTATLTYGLQQPRIGNTNIFVLPSPSGQARLFWNETIWQNLADLAR